MQRAGTSSRSVLSGGVVLTAAATPARMCEPALSTMYRAAPRLHGGALPPAREYPPVERRWRLVLTAVLAIYGWRCLRTPETYRWLDALDLAIHETGHLVFAIGGETLALLGGTLLQLIVPAAFTVALWRQGDRHGATVPLWWVGQNCWNVAVYVRDARARALPLVGGGEHDWAILLAEADWLHLDQQIGGAVFLAGVLLYVTSVFAGWRLLLGADTGSPRGTLGDPGPGRIRSPVKVDP